MSSPDWALAAPGTVSAQEFSYWNARQSLFAALTEPTEVARKAAFGRTFETLGHVVHHLQDMAQPQHVRNDPHCNWFPCGLVGSGPSRYESFTQSLGSNLPTDPPTGYDITSPTFTSNFNNPRRFWHTETGQNSPSAGKGVAEFTNGNFVSYGTNFDRPGLFPAPLAFTIDPDVDVQAECQNAAWCSNLHGRMTFYGNIVRDNFLGQSSDRENRRASTFSTFDQDLINRGGTPRFSLNRFNFQAAHDFLIPRAVAYSAGMINYFFRGKIDLVPDDTNPGTFLIKNLGSEPMTGDFGLYYDYDAPGTRNNRTLLIDWRNISIPENGQLNIGTVPADPTNPAPKNSGIFMLVFKGDMGAESTAEFGAVVGKIVSIAPWTFTDIGPIYPSGGKLGINDAGQVAGTTTANAQAFLWSSGSGMQLLPGGVPSFAHGINSSGLVVGLVDGEAALWSGTTGVQHLGALPVSISSQAFGINSSGLVVGTSILGDPTGMPRAFLWSAGSGMQDFGPLENGRQVASEAYAINSSGQDVGYNTFGGIQRAFLWTPGSGMQDLGTLPGGTSSVAYGINDIGQVVGQSDSSSGRRAFIWTSGSGMQDLGTLPGSAESNATGINNNGQVVGVSSGQFGSNPRTFLWSSGSGMQDLSVLLQSKIGDWQYIAGGAINDAGQIAGAGPLSYSSAWHAFLLSRTRR